MYPTSNVRIVRVLTVDSFYGCSPCAHGVHGDLDDAGLCLCCRWQPTFMAGDTIEVSS